MKNSFLWQKSEHSFVNYDEPHDVVIDIDVVEHLQPFAFVQNEAVVLFFSLCNQQQLASDVTHLGTNFRERNVDG